MKYRFRTMFDVRFNHPSTWTIAGSSQSGKTTFVLKLLRHLYLFKDGTAIKNIIYFYKEWQSMFDIAKSEKLVSEFVNTLPSLEDVRAKVMAYVKQGGSIIIIDDFMQSLTSDISTIFTSLSHHSNVTVFLITQNLFGKNPVFREISLNSTYIVLMKNPRDASQVSHFARQVMPGRPKFVVDVYKEATKHAHSYLLFDNHQKTPDCLRIRSRILPNEAPMHVWMERTC